MKQQIIWTTEAENDLAELWLASEDREAVVDRHCGGAVAQPIVWRAMSLEYLR